MATTTEQIESFEFEAFKKISKDQYRIMEVLCKEKDELDYFDTMHEEPIPEEVQSRINYAKDNDMYCVMRIWHNIKDDDEQQEERKLFFLVGVVKKQWDYDGTDYLIARWGSDLPTWDQLLKRAVDEKRELIESTLKAARENVDRNLTLIQGETDKELLCRTVPYISGLL